MYDLKFMAVGRRILSVRTSTLEKVGEIELEFTTQIS
jgi:hypothetical protein